MEKYIITDVDGVTLDWHGSFSEFMRSRGYARKANPVGYFIHDLYEVGVEEGTNLVREFNESPAIGFLEPYADSVKYINKLASDGFKFIAVTSAGLNYVTKLHRATNLKNHFGDVFVDVHCIDLLKSKRDILKQWKDSRYIWVDDLVDNYDDGMSVGLTSVLVTHSHNANCHGYLRVDEHRPWEEIYSLAQYIYNK